MKVIHINNPYIYIAIFTIALVFAGCEQTVTSDQNLSSGELNSELNAQQGPTLQPPPPDVEHLVDTFNPYLKWPIIQDAKEFKFQREKCCTSPKNFTVKKEELDLFLDDDGIVKNAYKDGEIIHSHLEAVDIAIPDEWLRYRVKVVFENNEESSWTGWLYYHLPDENNM